MSPKFLPISTPLFLLFFCRSNLFSFSGSNPCGLHLENVRQMPKQWVYLFDLVHQLVAIFVISVLGLFQYGKQLRENYRAFKNRQSESLSPKNYESYSVPNVSSFYFCHNAIIIEILGISRK